MADVVFSSWQGTMIDNRGKAKEEYAPLQVKLPAEFEKGVPVRALWDGMALSSVMRTSILSICVSSMQVLSRKNPVEDACLAG